MKSSRRRTLKTASAAMMAAGLLAFGVSAASAHVNVNPDDPAAGGYTHLTFNVPNESATAKTNKLEVALPTDTPFNSVSVKPVEGWTAQLVTTTLPKPITVAGATVTKAISSVVWTADAAHQIGQNEYQAFSISVGVLPDAGTTVSLPATQTYTDGSVVKWDEKTVAGQPEPEHPAPSFVTTASDDAAASTSSPSATPAPSAAASTSDAGSTAGWFGLAAGLIGLAVGVTALVRTRSTQAAK
ncbi:YcnI family protein [Arthrobacter bambusae]|uniref:YcnI family copper-binding membrane protein n=1 Tax=Arthrobacter TaxID=1663 RepID=UPI001F510FDA|nr:MULTISPECIES: YcnI family protein [Arthrobacter]MCI0141180.1 YcnI family protein [Arthrobacter bambusae]UYY82652.1 YcnI family protein [Arthrobacter sp. YA7-1]